VKIAILGAGSWGTALAAVAADLGHDAWLWGRDPARLADVATRGENVRYLPGRALAPSLRVAADLEASVSGAGVVVIALPVASVRAVAAQLGSVVARGSVVVCAAKGLEAGSHLTPDEVLADVLPGRPIALLSGPTFASEIARGLPAAAVVASRDPAAATATQAAFANGPLRLYTSDDPTGVAVGGALKNVIAIATGCADALGFGGNARAALITRGLSEITRLAVRLGANPLTLAGLAGLGDLVLTCTDDLSRNRRVGLALGRGDSPADAVARLGQVAEGVPTAGVAAALARRLGIEMPITDQVAAVVAGERSPQDAVAALLTRSLRAELD
jgi:glycerol-3-phosphate dehydrogenase (NAD(P)+)